MRIRKATLDDAVELSRLHKSTIRQVNSVDYSPEEIDAWSKRTSAKRFREAHDLAIRYVAIEDGKIVGFCDIKKEDPEIFWGLYVHKDFLGKGVGTALMSKIEDVARKKGAKKFVLSATITAKTFYEKKGFSVVKKKKYPIEDQLLDVFLMEKKL